ncbi:hypothetical protein QVD17_38874 [Tagetes erecta]|uniref:Uncharacterized protein n=1 Tax=Tagetes erecta TaxID=13708 RepID=A0AAD8JSZ2_TARER|nr:hypothetical protein QVD17_38874 [Tagetes erecta]
MLIKPESDEETRNPRHLEAIQRHVLDYLLFYFSLVLTCTQGSVGVGSSSEPTAVREVPRNRTKHCGFRLTKSKCRMSLLCGRCKNYGALLNVNFTLKSLGKSTARHSKPI